MAAALTFPQRYNTTPMDDKYTDRTVVSLLRTKRVIGVTRALVYIGL